MNDFAGLLKSAFIIVGKLLIYLWLVCAASLSFSFFYEHGFLVGFFMLVSGEVIYDVLTTGRTNLWSPDNKYQLVSRISLLIAASIINIMNWDRILF